MVLIENSGVTQDIFFPRNTEDSAIIYTLNLHSEGMNIDYSFSGLTNTFQGVNYYKFSTIIDELPEGEYNYSLTAEGVNEIGLLRVGKITNLIIENNTDNRIVEYDG